jgi:hypothetical protein
MTLSLNIALSGVSVVKIPYNLKVLVSYRSNFVFVKTMKTAGSSTEAAFQEALWEEQVNHGQGWKIYRDGFCTPRLSNVRPSVPQRVKIVAAGRLPWKSFGRVLHLRNHSAPEQIRDALGSKFWGSSTKIINVRNPFDQVVSGFFYSNGPNRGDFESWVRLHAHKERVPFVPLLEDSWAVIRYESLQEDLRQALVSLGLPVPDQLPNYKNKTRPVGTREYRDLYTPASRGIVENLYRDELELLGYSF